MQRRQFLVGTGTAAATGLAGCLGAAEKSHESSFREDVESRGVTIDTVVVEDGVVEFAHENTGSIPQEVANVAVAYADQIGTGWDVDRLEGTVYAKQDYVWHVKTEWAAKFANDEITPDEYGTKINETLKPAVVVSG